MAAPSVMERAQVSLRLLRGGHGQARRGLAWEGGQLCEDAPSSWLAEEILLLPSAQLPAVLPCPALGEGPRRNI